MRLPGCIQPLMLRQAQYRVCGDTTIKLKSLCSLGGGEGGVRWGIRFSLGRPCVDTSLASLRLAPSPPSGGEGFPRLSVNHPFFSMSPKFCLSFSTLGVET
jgi:hypothetical protein